MTNIQQCLEHLGLTVKIKGDQLVTACYLCGDPKHCYFDPNVGVFHCFKCGGKGNLYMTVKAYNLDWEPKQIFDMLKQYNVQNNTTKQTEIKKLKSKKPKSLAFLKGKIKKAENADIERLANTKSIASTALIRFNPYRHITDDVMYLPVYSKPTDKKACGFLRVGLDGQSVKLADGRTEKYPVVGSHGLFKTLDDRGCVIFVEAWRDVAAAIAAGFNATASSGGASTWKDSWLEFFKGKNVTIIMDADTAGERAAKRAAQKIAAIARTVKIVKLPYEVKEKHGKDVYDYMMEVE